MCKKLLFFTFLVVVLSLSSGAWAGLNRATWNEGGNNTASGALTTLEEVDAWFADKSPDMELVPPPDEIDTVPGSQSRDRHDNYNMMLWGWVSIPVDGEYDWWLSADDQAALYVSTDNTWANLQRVAEITGWQSTDNWHQADGGGRNSSGTYPDGPGLQTYTAGQVLAVWGYMTERGGGDSLSIGWIAPGETEVTLIEDFQTFVEDPGATLVVDKILREAEYPDTMGANTSIQADPTASGLKFFTDDGQGSNTGSTTAEWVNTYNFEATGGDYKILARVIAPNGSDDSLWVRIPTATAQTAEHPDQAGTGWVRYNSIKGSDVWVWDEVHSNDHDNATVIWTLPAGQNAVEIAIREDGTKLDGFVITNKLDVNEDTMPSEIDPPPIAGAPVPEDGAIEVDTSALEWTAADVAVSHKVYLSTDETIDDADLIGETDLALQIAILDPGVSYWWRVDTVEADGTVNTGEVWVFDTIALEAHFPVPEDGAKSRALDTQLGWTAGKIVIMHDVYFGTDEAAIAARDMSTFKGKLMDASYDPGPLEPETTYYWAVDEFAPPPTGTVAGPVWSFSTIGSVPITDERLMVYYDFESIEGGIVIDQSGHSNHGQVMGDPQLVAGVLGSAMEFDGDDYLDSGYTEDLATFTIACWAKSPAAPSGDSPSGPLHREKNYQFNWNHGNATYQGAAAMNNGDGWPAAKYEPVEADTWYFLTATFDGTLFNAYRDGVLITSVELTAGPVPETGTMKIARHATAAQFFTGTVDEARVYNVALTDVEILALGQPHIADVTGPGDVVKGVPDEPRDGSVAGWPDNEHPALALDDDVSTKFLHFRGEVSPTGFVVEPAVGPTIVTGLRLTTANDAEPRDPASYEISGSNESIDGPYELIAAGDLVDFTQADVWPRFTMNATPITFENTVAYKYYQVMFPTVRDAGSANSMQIAEVELLGVTGPIAHWPLDGDALDVSGNGNDGVLMGDPQFVAGMLGDAIDLDGVDDFIDCGNAELFDITGPMTVAAWIKVDVFDKSWQAIVTHGDSSWRIHRSSGSDNIAWGTSGASPADITGTTNVNDGEWHHIAGV
ncbi:MAG: LamG domain-containing protein, partial [Planctomycetota bacterium]